MFRPFAVLYPTDVHSPDPEHDMFPQRSYVKAGFQSVAEVMRQRKHFVEFIGSSGCWGDRTLSSA